MPTDRKKNRPRSHRFDAAIITAILCTPFAATVAALFSGTFAARTAEWTPERLNPVHAAENTGSVITETDEIPESVSIDGLEIYRSGAYAYAVMDDGCAVVTAYYGSAENIFVPETMSGRQVTRIGDNAFFQCGELNSVVIPEGVVSIGASAFAGDSSLEHVELPQSLIDIGSEAFYDCGLTDLELPDRLLRIGEYAFDSCDSLVNLSLPDRLSVIENGTFMNCSSMKTIELPEGISSIGDFAFFGCTSLREVSLSEKLEKIGSGSFAGCSMLDHVVIPTSVTDIGKNAFAASEGLRILTFGGKDGVISGVLNVGEGAFYTCSGLREINMPEDVSHTSDSEASSAGIVFGQGAFEGCANLKNLTLTGCIAEFGEDIFRDSGLEKVELTENIRNIGEIFKGCGSLSDIYFRGTRQQWQRLCGGNSAIAPDQSEVHFEEGMPKIPVLSDIEAFVVNIYQSLFGRPGDRRGVANWSDALYDKETTVADVIFGFVYSPEFEDKQLTDEEYVKAMYETILGRLPDKGEIDAWVELLNFGCTRQLVLTGLTGSDELKNRCDDLLINPGLYVSNSIVDRNPDVTKFMSRMFLYAYGRKASEDELSAAVGALLTEGKPAGSAAKELLLGSEMEKRSLSDKAFVTNVNMALFGSEPEAEKLDAWVKALEDGQSRSQLVDELLASEEFAGLCEALGITV